MDKIDYIIAMLEKICYYNHIDTEPMKTGIYYRYDVFYQGIFLNSFKSLRQAEEFLENNFGNNPETYIVQKSISQ